MHDVMPVVLFVRPEWYDRANCASASPALFYAERGESIAIARAVCDACEVREECLRFAVERGEAFGMWGGATPRQRTIVRRANHLTRQGRYLTGPRS